MNTTQLSLMILTSYIVTTNIYHCKNKKMLFFLPKTILNINLYNNIN